MLPRPCPECSRHRSICQQKRFVVACLSEGTYLLAELWGNNRKSEMLMKWTRVGCELLSAAAALSGLFFLTTFSFPMSVFAEGIRTGFSISRRECGAGLGLEEEAQQGVPTPGSEPQRGGVGGARTVVVGMVAMTMLRRVLHASLLPIWRRRVAESVSSGTHGHGSR